MLSDLNVGPFLTFTAISLTLEQLRGSSTCVSYFLSTPVHVLVQGLWSKLLFIIFFLLILVSSAC